MRSGVGRMRNPSSISSSAQLRSRGGAFGSSATRTWRSRKFSWVAINIVKSAADADAPARQLPRTPGRPAPSSPGRVRTVPENLLLGALPRSTGLSGDGPGELRDLPGTLHQLPGRVSQGVELAELVLEARDDQLGTVQQASCPPYQLGGSVPDVVHLLRRLEHRRHPCLGRSMSRRAAPEMSKATSHRKGFHSVSRQQPSRGVHLSRAAPS